MKTKIRLLEERVQTVVDRLQTLTAERDRLQRELGSLEQRLQSTESEAGLAGDPDVQARLDEIGGSLREAIAELRGD